MRLGLALGARGRRSGRRYAAAGLAALAVAVAGGALPATASAESTTAPIAFSSFNPCNGEPVTGSGTLHVVSNTHFDQSLGLHVVNIEMVSSVEAVGLLSQVRYTGRQRQQEVLYTSGFPLVSTLTHSAALRSATNLDNFSLTFQVHLTVNANGDPTAEVLHPRVACTG